MATFPMYHDAMVKFDLYGPPCEGHRDFTKVTFMLACDHAAKNLKPNFIQYVPTVSYYSCFFYLIHNFRV